MDRSWYRHSIDKEWFPWIWAGRMEVWGCLLPSMVRPWRMALSRVILTSLEYLYTCCDGFVSGLTMNKSLTKRTLQAYDIPMAREVLVTKAAYRGGRGWEDIIYQSWDFLFVKPMHGSSFGVRKVKNIEELIPAIEYAFQFDQDVMVESMMAGREFGNGVMRINGDCRASGDWNHPTEGVLWFWSQIWRSIREVTPAEISSELERQVKEYTSKIYTALNCSGLCKGRLYFGRGHFHLIGSTSVPGLSGSKHYSTAGNSHGWTQSIFDLCGKWSNPGKELKPRFRFFYFSNQLELLAEQKELLVHNPSNIRNM